MNRRDRLLIIIKKARSKFQMLLSVAATAVNKNPRSRPAIPIRGERNRRNSLNTRSADISNGLKNVNININQS